MRKNTFLKSLFCSALLLSALIGCHTADPVTEGGAPSCTGSLMRYSAAIGDTAYFVIYPGEMLMTFSEETMTVSLLCMEDGCDHSDPALCRAPVVTSLTTDGDALYMKCGGECFCRWAPGESDVTPLFSEEEVSGQMTSPISVADGVLYYSVKYPEHSEHYGRAAFYGYSLSSGARTCLYGDVSAYSCLAVCGDTFYYTEEQTLKNAAGDPLANGTYFVGNVPSWEQPVYYAGGQLMTYDGTAVSAVIEAPVVGDVLYRDGHVFALSAEGETLYRIAEDGTVTTYALSLPADTSDAVSYQLVCVLEDGCLVRVGDTDAYVYCTYDGACTAVTSILPTADDPYAPFS